MIKKYKVCPSSRNLLFLKRLLNAMAYTAVVKH